MLDNSTQYGLRLIDLISTTEPITKLYDILSDELSICKAKFYTDDEALWNDFIERMCDKYYSRTLNFDTYYEFAIKLKLILEDNAIKYNQIFKTSLLEINPLYTHYDEEDSTAIEDGLDVGTNDSTNDSTSHSESKYDSTNNSDSDTRSTNKDDNTSVNLASNMPQSNVNVAGDVNDTSFVSAKTTSQNNTTGDTTSIVKSNDVIHNENINDSTDNIVTNSTNNLKHDAKNTLHRVSKGWNGSQAELLMKYKNLVFDANKEIMKDIDDASLFMNIFY